MITSSNGNIFRVTGTLWGESTGHRWIPLKRPVTRNFDVFFDLRWTNSWANNRVAGDFRRHHAHHDVTVMVCFTSRFMLTIVGCPQPGGTWTPHTCDHTRTRLNSEISAWTSAGCSQTSIPLAVWYLARSKNWTESVKSLNYIKQSGKLFMIIIYRSKLLCSLWCLEMAKYVMTLTHWGRDKWTPFRRRHIQMHFLEWKCLNTD